MLGLKMNNECGQFETGVCEKIGFYVYRLLDGLETFYIGKGKNNRVFDHETQAKNENHNSFNARLNKIQEAKRKGSFQIVIHRHGLSEEQAYLVESALIDMHISYGLNLTNLQSGYQQSRYGICSPEQLSLSYSVPKASILRATKSSPANVILISINSSWSKEEKTPEGILKMVQYAWRIRNPHKEEIPYVFAVANKIIRGVYVVHKWLDSSDEEWINVAMMNKSALVEGRYGFIGSVAPPEIWSRFVNTQLPEEITFGSGQPILYGRVSV
jgi:hypothetical protein